MQAPKQAAVGGAVVTTVSAVTVVSSVTVISAVIACGEAAFTSLGEACSRPLGVRQTREQLGVPFWKT